MTAIKLKRISTGQYQTWDGRFRVMNTYSSGSLPGRYNPTKDLPWLVEDKSGSEPFYYSFQTLTEAKTAIKTVLRIEAEEERVLSAGYERVENQEKPGRC